MTTHVSSFIIDNVLLELAGESIDVHPSDGFRIRDLDRIDEKFLGKSFTSFYQSPFEPGKFIHVESVTYRVIGEDFLRVKVLLFSSNMVTKYQQLLSEPITSLEDIEKILEFAE